MTCRFKRIVLISAFIFSVLNMGAFAEDYIQVHAAIDISTVASDGRYTISQIADIARKEDVKIVIAADGFFNRWEYGLWPLRKIIKKAVETKSVLRLGIRRYLSQLKMVERDNPDMIFLGAVEVGPFYYWEGSPFGDSFTIKDWHKHLLVIGLETARDYKNLPVIGNGLSLAKPFGVKSILYLLLLFAALVIGLSCMRRGALAQQDIYERRFGLLLRQWKYIGIFLVISVIGIFINSYPFRDFKYDQYHGDRGALPYQNMIDYVKARGGATFWEHPEAKNVEKVGSVSIETDEHADCLLSTYNYTGFAVFYEGYDRIGAPDRIWDEALKDYCRGIRPSPVWAIGALDFEKAGNLSEYMMNLRTVFLLSHFTKADTLGALKEGRMYVSKDKEAANFILDTFAVKDPSTALEKIMGQELTMTGKPHIIIGGHFLDKAVKSVRVTLIKNGEMIKIIDAKTPFRIDFEDNNNIKDNKFYYRVEIRSEGLTLVTNPIFVSSK